MQAIEEAIFQIGINRGVLTTPGSWFRAEANVKDEADPACKLEAQCKTNADIGMQTNNNQINGKCEDSANSGTGNRNGIVAQAPKAGSCENRSEQQEMFFRATFAAVEEGLVTEAIRRFGEAVREVFVLA